MKASEVFVPGGQPTVTYFNRVSVKQELAIREYLASPGQILSVTGPTKSGKTVGIKRVIDGNGIFLAGGSIRSLDDFWAHLSYHVDAYTEEEITSDHSESLEGGGSTGLNLGVLRAGVKASKTDQVSSGRTQRRDLPASIAVSERLRERRTPVVVDDFHYIDRLVQTEILRAIRPLIFDGVPIILLSVPHRGDDAVRAEPELNGRVTNLQVPLWEERELVAIAEVGFKALNMNFTDGVIAVLANQASGSPHLMQDFCLRACRHVDVHEKRPRMERFSIAEDQRDQFFAAAAASAFSRAAIGKLIRGPQSRSDRKMRRLRSDEGRKMDIYNATVVALCGFGPKEKIEYNAIRSALRQLLVDADVPQKHEITRVLRKMHDIAANAGGEPVMEWDHDDGVLYITDPFFSFLLRFLTRVASES